MYCTVVTRHHVSRFRVDLRVYACACCSHVLILLPLAWAAVISIFFMLLVITQGSGECQGVIYNSKDVGVSLIKNLKNNIYICTHTSDLSELSWSCWFITFNQLIGINLHCCEQSVCTLYIG